MIAVKVQELITLWTQLTLYHVHLLRYVINWLLQRFKFKTICIHALFRKANYQRLEFSTIHHQLHLLSKLEDYWILPIYHFLKCFTCVISTSVHMLVRLYRVLLLLVQLYNYYVSVCFIKQIKWLLDCLRLHVQL